MPIDFTCPDCGKEMTARDELAGRRGKCSRCGQAFRVPGGTMDFPAMTEPMIAIPEVTNLVDDRKPPGWHKARDFAVMVLGGIAEAISNLAIGISQLLVVGEWVVTRLALYAMVLGGIGGSLSDSSAEPLVREMHAFRGHLSWMIGILGLAIVSRMPRKELLHPKDFSPRHASPRPKAP